jgi:hypothetical protein
MRMLAFLRNLLEIECAGIADAGFTGVGALDAADEEEFLAPALEVSLDGFHILWRHNKNHSDA